VVLKEALKVQRVFAPLTTQSRLEMPPRTTVRLATPLLGKRWHSFTVLALTLNGW
jgi:hypothetical protein